jgi:transcription elongation factor Elf1
MNVTCYFECPKCSAENAVQYDLGEHFADIPENCDECNHHFTESENAKIYEQISEDAPGNMADLADAYNDRYYDR